MSAWAVTGIGIIATTGDSAGCLFEALCERVSRIKALGNGSGGTGQMPAGTMSGVAGLPGGVPAAPVMGFDPKVYIARKGLRDLSRTSQLACAAAAEVAGAVKDLDSADIGVALGSAWGSLKTVVEFERAAHINGPRFVDPLLFTETVSNVPAGQIAIFNGWSAFNVTVSAGSASGLEAIGEAITLLEEGRARAAIAGGADEIDPPLLRALLREGRLAAAEGSFPFSEGRQGPSGGEGACLIAIEEETSARQRGAEVFGRILSRRFAFADPVSRGGARFLGGPRGEDSRMSPDAQPHLSGNLPPGNLDRTFDAAGNSRLAPAPDESGSGSSSIARGSDASREAPGHSAGRADPWESESESESEAAHRLATCILEALEEAGLRPADVDLIALSGNGSVSGDRDEARAVIAVFGSGTTAPPVIAPKAIVGETWGASGPIALVAALEAMRHGRVPARVAGSLPAPDVPALNFPAETIERPIRHALILALTESGHVGCLVAAGPA